MKLFSKSFFLQCCMTAFILLPLACLAQEKNKEKDNVKEKSKEKEKEPLYTFKEDTDSTYGKGGRKLTDVRKFKDGSTVTNEGIRDKDKKFRQNTRTSYDGTEGTTTVEVEYYDSNEKKTRETSVTTNRIGDTTYRRDEYYKDGVIDTGDIYEEMNGHTVHKRYNKDTQKYEIVEPAKEKEGKENTPEKKNDLDVTSYLFIGPSLISEDNYPNRFNTYGGTVVYIRGIKKSFGITAQVGVYFGSDNNTNSTNSTKIQYTKIQVLVGANIFAARSGSLFFSPHVLGGISHVKSKYESTVLYSGTAFTAVAGTDIGVSLNRRFILNGRADYNPTFASGGVKHDFWFSAGVYYKF